MLKSAAGNEWGCVKKSAGGRRCAKWKGRCTSAKHCSFLLLCNQVHGRLEVKSHKSGHFMKTLSPTLLSKGKQLIVHDKLKTFGPLCKIRFPAPPPPFLGVWMRKSCTSCMPCKCKRKEVTFIGPEFICIPALPSPYVSFYERAQAKH